MGSQWSLWSRTGEEVPGGSVGPMTTRARYEMSAKCTRKNFEIVSLVDFEPMGICEKGEMTATQAINCNSTSLRGGFRFSEGESIEFDECQSWERYCTVVKKEVETVQSSGIVEERCISMHASIISRKSL
jgi:hypothetical protein